MKLSVGVRQRYQSLGRAPAVFVGPCWSQHPRSWHSSPTSRATRRGAVPSFTARKNANKAFRSLEGQYIDHVTLEAIKNLGCQSPDIVFSSIIGISSASMSMKWRPEERKENIMFACSTLPLPEKELDLTRMSSSKCANYRITI